MKVDWKRILHIALFWFVIRIVLGVWMWGIGDIFHAAIPVKSLDSYKGVLLETNPWLEPWQRWDTPQYQAIAERGYTALILHYSLLLFTLC